MRIFLILSLLLAPTFLSAERNKIGENVPVASDAMNSGTWLESDDGRVWRLPLGSAGAGGLRVHFTNFHIGQGEVRIRSQQDSNNVVGPMQGDGYIGNGEFWSPTISGDSIYVEYRGDAEQPPFQITELGHFYAEGKNKNRQRDLVACYGTPPTSTQPGAKSVALLVFLATDPAGQFWTSCTGAFISGTGGRVLILTAHHCIRLTSEAQSAEVYLNFTTKPGYTGSEGFTNGNWFPSNLPSTLTRVVGTRILLTTTETEGDESLLEPLQPTPAGFEFSAYETTEPPIGTSTFTLHHPEGLFLRMSPGQRLAITSGNEAGVAVAGKFRPSDYYYKIQETAATGLTDVGSSGSAVRTQLGSLFGTLSYGPNPSCTTPGQHGVYARFSTFLPRIQTMLTNVPVGSCLLDFNIANQTVASTSGSGTFQVFAPNTCRWAIAADFEHIQVSQHAGSGNATVNYQFSANTDPVRSTTGRLGTISIIGEQRRVVHFLQRGTNQAPTYLDYAATYIFAEEINYLKRQNVIAYGCPQAESYCPEAITTRGQMAEFIIRSLYPAGTFPFQQTPFFTDVPTTHPAFAYIQKMAELRITAGCDTTLFCPDRAVTRGEMSVFIVRAKSAKNGLDSRAEFSTAQTPYFTDIPATHVFFPFIQELKELGITSGCTATTYCGNDSNTRGQIAVFLARGVFALNEFRF